MQCTWTGQRGLENVISYSFPGPKPHTGKVLTKQLLSHWIIVGGGLMLWPIQVRDSGVLLACGLIPLEEWLHPGLYLRAYLAKIFVWASYIGNVFLYSRLDITAPTLMHTVLRVGSSEGQGLFCVISRTGQSVVRVSSSGNTGVSISHE